MNDLHSYPSIFNIGHPAVTDILTSPVIVQEKVDGSQFSFGRKGDDVFMRSKRVPVDPLESGMFNLASVKVLELFEADKLLPYDGWVFRGEYLQKPKHNSLTYNRVPEGNIILFDVETSPSVFLSPFDLDVIAKQIGVEAVPTLYAGMVTSLEMFEKLLETESILGGPKVEGVVIKNYAMFGMDKKVLMAKHVSEVFKEIHTQEWRKSNPTRKDVVIELTESLRVPARWEKAIQRLRDEGKIEDSPKDIGNLMVEVRADLNKEATEWVKEKLFAHFWPDIQRGALRGLPEWYKSKLLEKQFE